MIRLEPPPAGRPGRGTAAPAAGRPTVTAGAAGPGPPRVRMSPPSHPRPPAAAGLFDALRRYARTADASAATGPADVEAALVHLQKLATLGQLAADVAHDFGNLTTVMLG